MPGTHPLHPPFPLHTWLPFAPHGAPAASGIRTVEATLGEPLVMDFGLAKDIAQDSSLSQAGRPMGTPSYMPPEQWESPAVGPAADVWALGVMLYQALTGRDPFGLKLIQPDPDNNNLNVPENLPTGARLAVGSALCEVTDKPHTGCNKFVERFVARTKAQKIGPGLEWGTDIGSLISQQQLDAVTAHVDVPPPTVCSWRPEPAADPANAASRRVAYQGKGSIAPTDISADNNRILFQRNISNRESRLAVLDVSTGRASELGWTAEPAALVNAALGSDLRTGRLYDYAQRDGSSHATLLPDVIESVHRSMSVARNVSVLTLEGVRAARHGIVVRQVPIPLPPKSPEQLADLMEFLKAPERAK